VSELSYAEDALLRLIVRNDEKVSEVLVKAVQNIVNEHEDHAFREGAKVAEDAAVRAIEKHFAGGGGDGVD
jgi:hypothetical protein